MPTNQYYQQHAEEFTKNTLSVDMSELYKPFLTHIPKWGRILDAGCGTGRDATNFSKMGYKVDAFDASSKMVEIATRISGLAVQHTTFEQFNSTSQYDGIWACASLLHVPATELNANIKHLAQFLLPTGVFYISFKYGSGETIRNGRLFTDCNEDELNQYLKNTDLVIDKLWLSEDQRPERQHEKWLNALLKFN